MTATDGIQLKDLAQQEPSLAQPPGVEPETEGGIRVTHHKEDTKISLVGTADPAMVEALHACLAGLADGDKDVVIDCSLAEHVPASVFQVLVAAQITLAKRQRKIAVESESPGIRTYLALAGFSAFFPLQSAPPPAKRKKGVKAARSIASVEGVGK